MFRLSSSPSETEERDVIALIAVRGLDPLAQNEAVDAGKSAGVVAGPENQVICLND
jgi:hypothetical protein